MQGNRHSSRSYPVAVVGDLHGYWDEADVEYFNQSDYTCIMFTGDLGSSHARDGVKIARSLSRLNAQVLVMPGNNDALEHARIMAELHYQTGRADILAQLDSSRGTNNVRACGYSSHTLDFDGHDVTLIAARPFAMGGNELSFVDALERAFDVSSLSLSAKLLKGLIERAPTEDIVVLAHNGPYGLGGEATSPFGRDFDPDAGDWGDRDLAAAVEHAKSCGKKLLAVCAGHMHWPLKDGRLRPWQVREEKTLFINAARVPRHIQESDTLRRHHIALSYDDGVLHAEERWVTTP